MRECQLRIYRIKGGVMAAFVERWTTELVPLRRANGFEVLVAWTSIDESHFIWVVAGGDDSRSFAACEKAYSEARASQIDFTPSDYIEAVVLTEMVGPVKGV